jgi:hypothetical protein
VSCGSMIVRPSCRRCGRTNLCSEVVPSRSLAPHPIWRSGRLWPTRTLVALGAPGAFLIRNAHPPLLLQLLLHLFCLYEAAPAHPRRPIWVSIDDIRANHSSSIVSEVFIGFVPENAPGSTNPLSFRAAVKTDAGAAAAANTDGSKVRIV